MNSGDWHVGLRPCAEALLTALLDRFTETTVAKVLALLQETAAQPMPPPGKGSIARNNAMRVVLKKDACYHAAMLASTYVPENALNFPNWFHTSLSPEVPQAMACSPKVGAISRDILLLVTHFCFDLKVHVPVCVHAV